MASVMVPCCDADEPQLTRRELFKQAVEAASVRDVPAFAALVDGNVREVLRNYEDIFCVVTRVRVS